MIKINLLPHHLRPIKRTPVPYLVGIALWVVAVLVIGSMFLAKSGEVRAASRLLAQHEQDRDALSDIILESNNLVDQKNNLARKIQAIDEIVVSRIIWSRQLWNLSRLLPDNFWYERVRIESRLFPVMVTKTDPTTNEPVEEEEMRPFPVLLVSGFIIEDATKSAALNPLLLSTRDDPEFSAMFTVEKYNFDDTELEDMDVRKFEIEYVITPGGRS